MAKYHINSNHMPGVCKAKNKCPYGDITNDHYESKEDAMQAIEKQALVETTYEKALKEYDESGAVSDRTLKELEKAKKSIGDTTTFDKDYSKRYDALIAASGEAAAPAPVEKAVSSKRYEDIANGGGLTEWEAGAYRNVAMIAKSLENSSWGKLTTDDLNLFRTRVQESMRDSENIAVAYAGVDSMKEQAADGFEQESGVYIYVESEINRELMNRNRQENQVQVRPDNSQSPVAKKASSPSPSESKENAQKSSGQTQSNIKALYSKLGVSDDNIDSLRQAHDVINSERINARIAVRELRDNPDSAEEFAHAREVYNTYTTEERKLADRITKAEQKASESMSGKFSRFQPPQGVSPDTYHNDVKLVDRFIDEHRARNVDKYVGPSTYITTNAGRLNPATMSAKPGSTADLIVSDAMKNKDSSFVVLAQVGGMRPRVVFGAGEELKDLENDFGKKVTQEKHGAGIGVTEGLHVVGYVSQDGEKFGYIPNKSVPFFAFD